MGWLVIVLLALAVVAGLYPFVRKDKGAFQFLLAALLIALAGYAWQGRPDQSGSPKAAQPPRAVPDDDFATLHPDLLGRFDRAYSWMQLADGDRRRGKPQGGATILQSAVRNNPRSYALWIAYGYALVAASDGVISPAAQLAFNRANQLAPGHPGPEFFYALALTYPRQIRTQEDLDQQVARLAQAEQIWRGQLRELNARYPLYRIAIEERIGAIDRARASGTALPPAAPLPQQPQGQGAPGAASAAPATPPGNETAPAPAPAPAGNSTN